jgi:hypothetical protein
MGEALSMLLLLMLTLMVPLSGAATLSVCPLQPVWPPALMLNRATGPEWKLRLTLEDAVELIPFVSVTVRETEFDAMLTVALHDVLHDCEAPFTVQL